MPNRRNLMWGLTLILAAALLFINKLGFLGDVNIFGLIISVLFVPIIIINALNLDFFGCFLPLAVIGIIYDKPLGIENLTPWTLILIAILLSLGFGAIFPRRHGHWQNGRWMRDAKAEEVDTESGESPELNFETKFGSSVKYVNATDIKTMNVECDFAGMKLYLDKAVLSEDGAVLNVDMNFSGLELFVPKEWNVVNNISCMMGGVEEKGFKTGTNTKKLTLEGKINLSGITILYI